METEGQEVSGQGGGGAAGSEREKMEELSKQVKDMEETLMEQWEYNANVESGQAPTIRTPAKPTGEEWRTHQVTHTHTRDPGVNSA